MRAFRLLPLLLVAACAGPRPPEPGPLLGELPVRAPPIEKAVVHTTLADVQSRYEALLDEGLEPQDRALVQRRLADLSMREAESRLVAGVDASEPLRRALGSYAALQEQQSASEPEVLLYQQARAHELLGETDQAAQLLKTLADRYPDADYAAEALFRWAEFEFSAGRYAAAETAYGVVADRYGESTLADDALYMRGWSRFKRGHYEQALETFGTLLDRRFPDDGDLDQLASGSRSRLEDTLRVMAIACAEFPGAEAIEGLAASTKVWDTALYTRLGELYLKQERFQDAASTWQAYLRGHSMQPQAPGIHQQLIATWEQGGYPSEILPEKERFVRAYGINSAYWADSNEAVRASLAAPLHSFLDELAREDHARAQQLAQGDDADSDGSRDAYLRAAAWYQEILQTFPRAPGAAQTRFLLGEVLFEAQDYVRAIAAYEAVAYGHADFERAADAGYAALLAFTALMDGAGTDRGEWEQAAIVSQLRFAHQFPGDQRTEPVLAQAATTLFDGEQYRDAIAVSEQMLARVGLAPEHRRTALLVRGQSAFAVQDYVLAEHSYASMLESPKLSAERREQLTEQLASAVYRQAETALASGDAQAAIDGYLRVAEVAPQTSARRSAQFQAGTLMLKQQQWQAVVPVLLDYRQRYPDDDKQGEINRRLILAYEQSDRWLDAATELETLGNTDADRGRAREALYLAADYYRRGGDRVRAIAALSAYCTRYPEPFALRIEALADLIELHEEVADVSGRRRWQEALIKAEQEATESTERARYLAAGAVLEFAEEARQTFDRQALAQPLARSLRAKRKYLEEAVDLYQRGESYGVQAYATQATYRTAEMYRQLAQELLALPVPAGLNALEQEQYLVLLEEQALPFEDLAIGLYQANAERSQQQLWDEWIVRSYAALRELVPARYVREEERVAYATQLD